MKNTKTIKIYRSRRNDTTPTKTVTIQDRKIPPFDTDFNRKIKPHDLIIHDGEPYRVIGVDGDVCVIRQVTCMMTGKISEID